MDNREKGSLLYQRMKEQGKIKTERENYDSEEVEFFGTLLLFGMYLLLMFLYSTF